MEKCTLYQFKWRCRDDVIYNFEEIKKLTVNLSDLKDFDQPCTEIEKRCRTSERTMHFTSDNYNTLLAFIYEDDWNWFLYTFFFVKTWIVAENDCAFRIHIRFAYANPSVREPFEKVWTLDFIKFGEKSMIPQCIQKLSTCLKELHQHPKFNSTVYKTLSKHFPNCLSKENGSKSFWVKFESSYEPEIVFSQTEPTWLDQGVNLNETLETAPLEWMTDIIVCFTFFARMRPDFGIVLKKPVHDNDTQVIFFVKNGNLPEFSIFLGTFNNFPKEVKKEKTSVAVLKGIGSLLPVVGTCMTVKDAVDAFKTGNPKTGTCLALLSAVSLVGDAFIVAGPAVSLVAKAAKSSPGVVKACAAITNVTAKAKIATEVGVPVVRAAGRAVKENASKNLNVPSDKVVVSDEALLKKVFPRLARVILGNSEEIVP